MGREVELYFHKLIRNAGIRGLRSHLKSIPGKPDFANTQKRVAIFIDSCFWHGCKAHLRMPASNVDYWNMKITRNVRRDREVSRELRRRGWRVLRIWAHDLKASQNKKSLLAVIKRRLES